MNASFKHSIVSCYLQNTSIKRFYSISDKPNYDFDVYDVYSQSNFRESWQNYFLHYSAFYSCVHLFTHRVFMITMR